ncbi:LpqB family beta-propeller domain-containing protein [Arthrobacter sp. H14-L1]|uniref:LpqB family beta-propeller domain-containing protein n=1 Tax=Arthrobacter sp. H14-L1 TaxID=2996697 RepID=UPI00226FA399|nr:LpqB family beta-propeller domain-containing protein [Arthrobacter sp. H14-L1]MCY0903548.1 LpqB family beta-propeller domain-containing protein [Arthrobacter sp. H14-L1]
MNVLHVPKARHALDRRGPAAVLLRLLVVVVVVLLCSAGCAVIPSSGVVGKSDPVAGRNNPVTIDFRQNAPVRGASPTSIIEGFIAAGTGVSDDFQVARQYLDHKIAGTWKADARTLVYKDSFKVVSTGSEVDPGNGPNSSAGSDFKIDFALQSMVDANGILTPADPGAVQTVKFSLVREDGEWRISSVPDGIMLQSANFATLYSPYSLYFYDPTFAYAVPDIRWLAGKATTRATSIVRAMLNGPAPYLKGAVASAFPDGIKLVRDSVPINNGVAQLDLTAQPLLDATVKARQQMQAQLLLTLQRNLNTVTSVTLRADTREIDLGPQEAGQPALVVNNQVPHTQVAVAKNELVHFDNGQTSPIDGLASMAKHGPSHPAQSYTKPLYAFLNADHSQAFSVAPGQAEVPGATGINLTAPSFSPQDWIWTAAGDGGGQIIAFHPDLSKPGQPPAAVVLFVQWLVGRTVTDFRVSRDGSRALIISTLNGVSSVQIAGILRAGDVPKDLTVPITVVSSVNPGVGDWVSETSMAVMRPSATGPVVVEILDLKSDPQQLAPLEGMRWLSAGNSWLDLYAQTDKDIYARLGNGWVIQAKDVTDASFAG